jgi:hypothetical protein
VRLSPAGWSALSSGHPFALLQAEVYDTPGGDLALEGVLHATLRGFSVHARILRSRTDGERDGIPVITVLEAELVGASLSPEPADPEAIFTRACDLPIEWQLREEAEEREHVLRSLRPAPALVREVSGYSHWGAPGFRGAAAARLVSTPT